MVARNVRWHNVVIPSASLVKMAIPSALKDTHAAQPMDYGFAVLEMVAHSLVLVLRRDLLATLVLHVKEQDAPVVALLRFNALMSRTVSMILMTAAILIVAVMIAEVFAAALLNWIKLVGLLWLQEPGKALQMLLLKAKEDGILGPILWDGLLFPLQDPHLSDMLDYISINFLVPV